MRGGLRNPTTDRLTARPLTNFSSLTVTPIFPIGDARCNGNPQLQLAEQHRLTNHQ
jgi:hypothetical protein